MINISARIIIIYNLCIVSNCGRIIRNIFCYHTTGTDSNIISYFYIFDNANIRSYVCIIANRCSMSFI